MNYINFGNNLNKLYITAINAITTADKSINITNNSNTKEQCYNAALLQLHYEDMSH